MKKTIFFLLLFFMSSFACMSQVLMIYGGHDHDVYLGNLNSNKYDSNSIWNQYGTYGSRYSSSSIWNQYSDYGSRYSSYSPFNDYASYPPVIVDEDGNFYGYFTSSRSMYQRASFSLVEIIIKYHTSIRDDVSGWYEKIFR